MTSMLDGTSIMHLASQLSNQLAQQQKQEAENSRDPSNSFHPSPSPSYTNNPQQITLEMFQKSGLFACLPQTETGVQQAASSQNSDTASSESPEPPHSGQENDEQQLHEAQQLALMRSLGQTIDSSCDGEMSGAEATMRDLMPVLAAANQAADTQSSQSAWARNAGRKKSHPVWEFFRDLKDTTGAGGVICLHCTWCGDDRSPNNLRTHLKKFHTDDGIFSRFSQKLAATPTQPYVKRVRGSNGTSHTNLHTSAANMLEQKSSVIDSMAFALQQLQQSGSLGDFNTSFNFLDSLPKSSEIINISSSGFGNRIAAASTQNSQSDTVDDEDAENHNHHHAEAASSSSGASASAADDLPSRNTETPDVAPATPTSSASATFDATSSADLAALVSNLASANPMVLAMLNAANGGATSDNNTSTDKSAESPTTEKDPSSFSLSDGPCAAVLMSMALDLDMTMSYHRRRVDIELCFESNRTAEKSGGRGKVICLTDMGKEIRIVERVNGAVSGTELWTKTDFNQFHWAIRGKCQKCFNKP